jgi:hypothetical protein
VLIKFIFNAFFSGVGNKHSIHLRLDIMNLREALNATLSLLLLISVVASFSGCGSEAYHTTVKKQLSEGYRWTPLEKCRPPRKEAYSIPIVVKGGKELVCNVLSRQRVANTQVKSPRCLSLKCDAKTKDMSSNKSSLSETEAAKSREATDQQNSKITWVFLSR